MKMSEAMGLIKAEAGYRVHFEKREGGFLHSDYFPERDEPAIADLDDAWRLAGEFAAVNPAVYVNVYVVSAYNHVPVEGYDAKKLNRYPSAVKASDDVVMFSECR